MVGFDAVSAQLEDHARELLAAAEHLDDPDHATLLDLGKRLQTIGSTLDVASLRTTLAEGDPRADLSRGSTGAVLGLRWYEPGERSTLHSHSWAVVLVLDGEGRIERWQRDGAGRARLTDACDSHPNDVVAFRDGEPHRQTATDTGVLELVLVGNEHHERVEHSADERSAEAAELIERFVNMYRETDARVVNDLFAPGVVTDINVPAWRFQVQGADVLESMLCEEEFLPEFELTRWRAAPMGAGAAIEVECHFAAHGERRMFREVHLLRRVGALVDDHSIYCSGHWSAATIERQRRDAPMIRR